MGEGSWGRARYAVMIQKNTAHVCSSVLKFKHRWVFFTSAQGFSERTCFVIISYFNYLILLSKKKPTGTKKIIILAEILKKKVLQLGFGICLVLKLKYTQKFLEIK